MALTQAEERVVVALLAGGLTTPKLASVAGVNLSSMHRMLGKMLDHGLVSRGRGSANGPYTWELDACKLTSYMESVAGRNLNMRREWPHKTWDRRVSLERAFAYIRSASTKWIEGEWTSGAHALAWGVYEQAVRDVYGLLKDRRLGDHDRRTALMTVRHGVIVDNEGAPRDILGHLGICPLWARGAIESSIEMGNAA